MKEFHPKSLYHTCLILESSKILAPCILGNWSFYKFPRMKSSDCCFRFPVFPVTTLRPSLLVTVFAEHGQSLTASKLKNPLVVVGNQECKANLFLTSPWKSATFLKEEHMIYLFPYGTNYAIAYRHQLSQIPWLQHRKTINVHWDVHPT